MEEMNAPEAFEVAQSVEREREEKERARLPSTRTVVEGPGGLGGLGERVQSGGMSEFPMSQPHFMHFPWMFPGGPYGN